MPIAWRSPLLLLALSSSLASMGACKDEPPPPDPKIGELAIKPGPHTVDAADQERAAAIVKDLRGAVMNALQQALPGGAPGALEACAVQAPALTQALAREGVRLGRATRQPRNPANEATGWQLQAIAQFERTSGAGKPLPGSVFVRKLPEGRIAYAEPLVIQELCLQCHGEAIAPDVKAALAAKYPADKATGYKVGDLRGVAWVELPPPGAGAIDVGGGSAGSGSAAPAAP